jgi:hypothetical protein
LTIWGSDAIVIHIGSKGMLGFDTEGTGLVALSSLLFCIPSLYIRNCFQSRDISGHENYFYLFSSETGKSEGLKRIYIVSREEQMRHQYVFFTGTDAAGGTRLPWGQRSRPRLVSF